jgi:hypothetical protein
MCSYSIKKLTLHRPGTCGIIFQGRLDKKWIDWDGVLYFSSTVGEELQLFATLTGLIGQAY